MTDPDIIIRFPEAGHDDPDRQMALRITNFVAGMDIRQAVAVYSLAMTMSFRQIEDGFQRAAMRAICEACFRSWAIVRGEPEPRPCGNCKGAGTIGATLESFETCPVCVGTGAA
jgi:DnaJ-class molecular chaperone